jgi:adenine-specific DNA-methyltransferase
MPESNALQRLQELLRDLFQFDYADLDFGIYRLLRLKRGEVESFLTEQLPRRVDEVFKGAAGDVHATSEREFAGLCEEVCGLVCARWVSLCFRTHASKQGVGVRQFLLKLFESLPVLGFPKIFVRKSFDEVLDCLLALDKFVCARLSRRERLGRF